jgi:protein-S-isoprenylcysteine O-methyltransferase Ste14
VQPYSSFIVWIWALWYAYWIFAALRVRKATVQTESSASTLSWRLTLLAGYACLFVRWPTAWVGQRMLAAGDATGITGVALSLLGLGFAVWARLALGSNWSSAVSLKQDHQLVRSGPYGLSRHPIYTGIITAAVGVAVNNGQWQSLLGLVLVAGSFLRKLAGEERFMRQQFGADYDAYASTVKKLVPFVY